MFPAGEHPSGVTDATPLVTPASGDFSIPAESGQTEGSTTSNSIPVPKVVLPRLAPKQSHTMPETQSQGPISKKPLTSSEEELKHICEIGVESFNAYDFNFSTPVGREYRSHMAPDFVAQFDAHERMLTFDELMNAFKSWYDEHEGFWCKYKHMTANVDEISGTGVVHYELNLFYENMCQEALGEMRFKRDARGVWMCHMYIGMRGIPGMGGYV